MEKMQFNGKDKFKIQNDWAKFDKANINPEFKSGIII